MSVSEKLALLSKTSKPGRDWISGWRVLQVYGEDYEDKVFVRNLMLPTDKPAKKADCSSGEFSAFWDAMNKKWLLENPNN